MSKNRFEEELQMVNGALEDEQSKDVFKEYLRPLVEAIADKYMVHGSARGVFRLEELIEAGWTHFDFALKKYKENADLMLERKKIFSISVPILLGLSARGLWNI